MTKAEEFERLDSEAVRLVALMPQSFLELGGVLKKIRVQQLYRVAGFRVFNAYLSSLRRRCFKKLQNRSQGHQTLNPTVAAIIGPSLHRLKLALRESRPSPISLDRATAYRLIRIFEWVVEYKQVDKELAKKIGWSKLDVFIRFSSQLKKLPTTRFERLLGSRFIPIPGKAMADILLNSTRRTLLLELRVLTVFKQIMDQVEEPESFSSCPSSVYYELLACQQAPGYEALRIHKHIASYGSVPSMRTLSNRWAGAHDMAYLVEEPKTGGDTLRNERSTTE